MLQRDSHNHEWNESLENIDDRREQSYYDALNRGWIASSDSPDHDKGITMLENATEYDRLAENMIGIRQKRRLLYNIILHLHNLAWHDKQIPKVTLTWMSTRLHELPRMGNAWIGHLIEKIEEQYGAQKISIFSHRFRELAPKYC